MSPRPDDAQGPDDGAADPRLRSDLRDIGARAVLSRPDARLLIAVIPDLDIPAEAPPQMAAATMINAAGERGLLAFSGLDSLTAWRAEARPMPMAARDVAKLARANGCSALVIDVLGPSRVAITGSDLVDLDQGKVTDDTRGCP